MSVWETAVPYLHLAWLGTPGIVAWLCYVLVKTADRDDLQGYVSQKTWETYKLTNDENELSRDWRQHLKADSDVKKIMSARP